MDTTVKGRKTAPRALLLLLCGAMILLLLFLARRLWGTNPRGAIDESPSPLRFEQSVANLGDVRDVHEVEHMFAFNVWDKGPVSIVRVDSSCGCTEVAPDLTKQTLNAGTTHSLRVKMRLSGLPGSNSAGVHFITDPPSPKPQMVVLKAWVLGRPQPSPKELFVKTTLGVPAQGVLYVNYDRHPHSPKLQLDREKSAFAPFVLLKETQRSESQARRQDEEDPAELDHLELSLKGKELFSVGTHHHIIRLAWKSGHPPLNLAIHVSVEHPLRPAIPEVFCGELTPGAQWDLDVPLVRSGKGKVELKSVTCDKDFIAITPKRMGASLGIKVRAPPMAGRFNAIATLTYTDPSLPPYSLPITGIVKSADR